MRTRKNSGTAPDPTKMSTGGLCQRHARRGGAWRSRSLNRRTTSLRRRVPRRQATAIRSLARSTTRRRNKGQPTIAAAHPDASQSEIDEAGRQAGEQAVFNSYQSGNVITGGGTTPDHTYPQYYGNSLGRRDIHRHRRGPSRKLTMQALAL